MELEIPRGILPDFLVEANEAVNRGHITEAIGLMSDENVGQACRKAEKDQQHADIIFLMLALIFQKTRQLKKAAKWYQKILEHQQNALVLNELGCIYQNIGRVSDAMEYRRRALEVDPSIPGICRNYATDLMLAGRMAEGIEILQEALEANPENAVIHSNLLWYLHYLPDQNPQMLLEQHKRWGQIHTPPSMAMTCHNNTPEPNRRLRIGYISPDFRKHSVAYNFEAFLSGRNPEAAEMHGYGSVGHPDEMTERLKKRFDHYRNVFGLGDAEVAGLIEKDKIDILVEIGGHTADNRLGVLAYKPAPIQVDYGGLSTSGMEQIDYRLTDELLDPPERHKFYIEESVCLPGGLFCYSPPDFAPPVAPLPAERNGYVTFGSFNGSLKINRHILSLWAQVLKADDNSRLLMKFPGAGDQNMKDLFLNQFEQLGVSAERIRIVGWKQSVEHLKLYGEVDIVLDTYPFNGCITTLEGLWMGAPVVSLVGKNSLLSRTGLSVLSRVGLEFFAAATPQEFVAKAIAFSRNVEALAKIRASLRQRMTASSLCDAKGYAASVEAAYRKMWYRWCRSKGVDIPDEKVDGDFHESNLAGVSVNTPGEM
ncbi:MAG: O-linked N-acetylglucosamine transferase, SPINDLY family protein [Planctomycetota bacterium]|jgi:predicted O-linked N-acetylglucosamine transferase (SPINDLY family)